MFDPANKVRPNRSFEALVGLKEKKTYEKTMHILGDWFARQRAGTTGLR